MSEQITAEQAKAYVRERWIKFEESIYDPHEGYTIPQTQIDIGKTRFTERKRSDAMLAAYAYTKAHERKIADLQYELSLQRLILANFDQTPLAERNPHDHDEDRAAVQRTITRLKSVEAELLKGWRQSSDKAQELKPTLRDIARELAKTMQCNCDLDNWEPEPDTGHSFVCRIRRAALEKWSNRP